MELTRSGAATTRVIPPEWRIAPLGDLVQITSGASPSRFRFIGEGIPYFKVEQLNNSTKYQVKSPYRFRGDSTVPAGSLIFPKRGAAIMLNKVRILAQDSFMDTNMMALTPGPGLDNEYTYYALIQIGLWRVADTASIPQINKGI